MYHSTDSHSRLARRSPFDSWVPIREGIAVASCALSLCSRRHRLVQGIVRILAEPWQAKSRISGAHVYEPRGSHRMPAIQTPCLAPVCALHSKGPSLERTRCPPMSPQGSMCLGWDLVQQLAEVCVRTALGSGYAEARLPTQIGSRGRGQGLRGAIWCTGRAPANGGSRLWSCRVDRGLLRLRHGRRPSEGVLETRESQPHLARGFAYLERFEPCVVSCHGAAAQTGASLAHAGGSFLAPFGPRQVEVSISRHPQFNRNLLATHRDPCMLRSQRALRVTGPERFGAESAFPEQSIRTFVGRSSQAACTGVLRILATTRGGG